jgi:hypothetical protein
MPSNGVYRYAALPNHDSSVCPANGTQIQDWSCQWWGVVEGNMETEGTYYSPCHLPELTRRHRAGRPFRMKRKATIREA